MQDNWLAANVPTGKLCGRCKIMRHGCVHALLLAINRCACQLHLCMRCLLVLRKLQLIPINSFNRLHWRL